MVSIFHFLKQYEEMIDTEKERERTCFLSLKFISGSNPPPPTPYTTLWQGSRRIREEYRRPETNLFNDIAFLRFRETLDAVMKRECVRRHGCYYTYRESV